VVLLLVCSTVQVRLLIIGVCAAAAAEASHRRELSVSSVLDAAMLLAVALLLRAHPARAAAAQCGERARAHDSAHDHQLQHRRRAHDA
jgi:hypothetical protein